MSLQSYSRRDEEKRLCNEWLKDPMVNPKTGMPIDLKGPTYLEWQKRCKDLGLSYKPIRTKELSYRKCQEWRKTPHVNPETGKQIMVGGTLYKRIERQCKNVTEKPVVLNGTYFPPDLQGFVPTVKSTNGSHYIVRHSSNRSEIGATTASNAMDHLVYGPLNALTYKNRTTLVHFKDTWDFKQGYYRPIFKGSSRSSAPSQPSHQTQSAKTVAAANTAYTTTASRSNPKSKVDALVNLFVRR
jgi:hypothetical protein